MATSVAVKTNVVLVQLLLMITIVTSGFVSQSKRGGGGGGSNGGHMPCVNSCRSNANGNMARCLRLSCRKHVFRYYMRIGKRQDGNAPISAEDNIIDSLHSMKGEEVSNVPNNPFLKLSSNSESEPQFPHIWSQPENRRTLKLMLLLQYQRRLQQQQRHKQLLQQYRRLELEQQEQRELQQRMSSLSDSRVLPLDRMRGVLEGLVKDRARTVPHRGVEGHASRLGQDEIEFDDVLE